MEKFTSCLDEIKTISTKFRNFLFTSNRNNQQGKQEHNLSPSETRLTQKKPSAVFVLFYDLTTAEGGSYLNNCDSENLLML